MKTYKLSKWSQESKKVQAAYIIDEETELAVDTAYYNIETEETWTHKGKSLSDYEL